ncbi:MAG: hypothetical protein ACI9MC_002759 [Kiritimatiellia bacterium]|jgi:hypothetical protein
MEISRRAMLRGALGTMIGLPLLDAMVRPRKAHADSHGPKRLIVVYTPNGTIPAAFWPTGSGRSYTTSKILTPLNRHRDDMLVLGGIDMLTALTGPGDAHQKGTGQCLTARPLLDGDFSGDAGTSAGWASGISVDQAYAQHLNGQTPLPSLELGVGVQGADVHHRIAYRAAGQPLPPDNDPWAVYQRLFADASKSDAEIERQIKRREAVFDTVRADFGSLSKKLGADDQVRVDAHLTAIEDVRKRMLGAPFRFGGSCQPIDLGAPQDALSTANFPLIGGLQMDLLALAMACDITRVATLMWTYSTADPVYRFVHDDIRVGHHSLAHKGDEDFARVDHNTRINAWFAGQLAELVDRLKAMPEGDGTVFDNTVILWTNEQSKGNNHSRMGMPYVLLGGAGGAFDTGRYVLQDRETSHNQLMVSLLQGLGVETSTFGSIDYNFGALPGL